VGSVQRINVIMINRQLSLTFKGKFNIFYYKRKAHFDVNYSVYVKKRHLQNYRISLSFLTFATLSLLIST
jgi:hypothetical protein